MRTFVKSAALSIMIGLGALSATPASANDGAFYLGFGDRGTQFSFHFGDRDRYYNPPRHQVRECTPRQAVHKARRMGLRDAYVARENRNVIRVRGHARGHGRVSVVFARAPHCPVIRTRG